MLRPVNVRSLGYRTDLMVLALGGSEVVAHEDHVVVRTHANPTFWWGNFVLFRDRVGPGDVEARLALFVHELPGAEHVAWGVDTTDGTVGDEPGLTRAGLAVSRDTVLTATGVRPPARQATATLRSLEGDDDWRQAVDLHLACNAQAAHVTTEFLERQMLGARALCERGDATWYGAFEGDVLRSALGIVTGEGGLARFQLVQTHPDARRQGLAGALLHRAGTAALDERAATLVIVADPEYEAIRLYRRAGFVDAETQVQLTRTPREPAQPR